MKYLVMQYPGEPNTKHVIRHENWRCEAGGLQSSLEIGC